MDLSSLLNPAPAREITSPGANTQTNEHAPHQASGHDAPRDRDAQDAADTLAALASGPPRSASAHVEGPDTHNTHDHLPHNESVSVFQRSSLPYDTRKDATEFQRTPPFDPNQPVSSTEDATEMPHLPNDYDADPATKAVLESIINEHGTRQRRAPPSQIETALDSVTVAPSPTSKEPAAPNSNKRRATNKPSNNKKPAPKKRKLEVAATANSPSPSQRTASPAPINVAASNRNSARNGGKRRKHAAVSSSPVPDLVSDDESVNSDDQNVYCICRKQDDHTFMVACEGPCNDWYHARCVNLPVENHKVLANYYCPSCTDSGAGVTKYYPKCRRVKCHEAAGRTESAGIERARAKYCSEDCKIAFWEEKQEEAFSSDTGAVGGPINAHHLRSMLDTVSNVEEFKNLGQTAPPSPPITPDGGTKTTDVVDGHRNSEKVNYTSHEQQYLQEIAAKKDALRSDRIVAKDFEKLVAMIKDRLSRLEKGQCGFDPRLAWDQSTFWKWRNSDTGKAIFESGSLPDDEEFEICLKKRCTRHLLWQKNALIAGRFEENKLSESMRSLDIKEKAIHELAQNRQKELEIGGDDEDDEHAVEVFE